MSETKFTPGPWKIGNGRKTDLYMGWDTILGRHGDGDKFVLARVNGNYEELGKENAKIIAAAPDMFTALENALRDMDKIDAVCKMAGVHEFSLMRAEIEKALKKARGE